MHLVHAALYHGNLRRFTTSYRLPSFLRITTCSRDACWTFYLSPPPASLTTVFLSSTPLGTRQCSRLHSLSVLLRRLFSSPLSVCFLSLCFVFFWRTATPLGTRPCLFSVFLVLPLAHHCPCVPFSPLVAHSAPADVDTCAGWWWKV